MELQNGGSDSLVIRTDKAIRNSRRLIRQSIMLRARTYEFRPPRQSGQEENPMGWAFLQKGDHVALNWMLQTALDIAGARMGNIQLIDSDSGDLQIAAHSGFSKDFLKFFDLVHDGSTACGQAAKVGEPVGISDIAESSIFRGTNGLEVMLDARVRAVQSTPLISCTGRVIGMISTHWPIPFRLGQEELFRLNVLARNLSGWLDHRLGFC